MDDGTAAECAYLAEIGRDKNARERWRGHRAFEMTERCCARYDRVAFDPAYETYPIERFAPLVMAVFGREPWRPHGRSERPLDD